MARSKSVLRTITAREFSYDDSVIETVAKRCTDVDSGASNVYNILTGTMLPDMSGEVLSRMASGEGIKSVHVKVGEGEKFCVRHS